MRTQMILFAISSLFALLPVCPVFSQGWEWQNPLPQGNRIAAISAVDENHLWAGTNAGVVLHTSDGGVSWQLQQTPSVAWFTGIHFADEMHGWAVGFEQQDVPKGIIVSTVDGGQTWVNQEIPNPNDGRTPELEAVEFIDASTGWAVGESGLILFTDNGGEAWQERSSRAANAIYERLFDLSAIDSSNVWVAGRRTLAHTEDGGQTWQRDTTEFGQKRWESVQFVDGEHGWLQEDPFNSPRLYKTTDSGKTWLDGEGNLTEPITYAYFISPDTGWAISANLIYTTSNGGESWNLLLDELIGTFIFLDNMIGWSRRGSSVYRTLDGGLSWQKLSNAFTFTSFRSVDFVDNQTGWAAGPEGTIFATKDGGLTWEQQESGVTDRLNHIGFVDRDTGWVVGFGGLVLRTQDGGTTWQQLQRLGGRNPNWAIFFLDASTGWLVGGNVQEPGWIRHTDDGGETWTEQTPGLVPLLMDTFFHDALTGWVVGDYGYIAHTSDGGFTWEEQNSGVNEQIRAVQFTNYLNGWALTEGGYVLHTIDSGQTWESMYVGGFECGLWGFSFADSENGWIVGGCGVIFSTNDGGKNWLQQVSGTKNSFLSVDFVNEHEGWTVGNFGTIMHTANGGVTRVESGSNSPELPTDFRLFRNFPNPFNPQTTIRYSLSQAGWVVLEVYNILGFKVRTLENAYKQPGDHQVMWDGLSDRGLRVSSGLYLYQFRFNAERRTGKMLLLR